jgi:hypothetical protein
MILVFTRLRRAFFYLFICIRFQVSWVFRGQSSFQVSENETGLLNGGPVSLFGKGVVFRVIGGGGEVSYSLGRIVALKQAVLEFGAVVGQKMADFLFGFVFNGGEQIAHDLADFGFVGKESHPDVVREAINSTEELLLP